MHYKTFTLICTSALLTSCMVGSDYHRPQTPTTNQYTSNPLPIQTTYTNGPGGKAQVFQPGQDIPKQWWALFQSQKLNTLIEQGLANNPTLDSAKFAIEQAEQNYKVAVGQGLFPNIAAQLGGNRQGNSLNNATTQGGAQNTYNLYNTSVNVSYGLDLFGGARRYAEQLRSTVEYQQYQWRAAYLTLTSNIVTTAITSASLEAQIQATESLIRAQENSLAITEKQFNLGAVSESEVLQQRTLLAQTKATLPPLQKNHMQYQNALAALVGKVPSQAQLPDLHLEDLTLPQRLPIGLPSQLIGQRPDVLASEALLHQASAAVGVATAARLPQFTITGNWGYSSSSTNGFFNPVNQAWNIGGQLTQPIFNGGALKAKQGAATAAYEGAAAQYQETVLQAFKDVANALNAIEADADALKTQTEAERAASASLRLIEHKYKLGAVDYLAQLEATRAYQQTRIARIQAQAARYADTAALFQALGGGWGASAECLPS